MVRGTEGEMRKGRIPVAPGSCRGAPRLDDSAARGGQRALDDVCAEGEWERGWGPGGGLPGLCGAPEGMLPLALGAWRPEEAWAQGPGAGVGCRV